MARFIWRNGHWVEYDRFASRPKPIAPMIMRDVEPYRSVITREVIGGRRQHREHLRAHEVIEVGNEMGVPKPEPLPPVAPDIVRALDGHQ
jgi:hypothetical protein